MAVNKHACCALTLVPMLVSAADADLVAIGGTIQANDSALVEFNDLDGGQVMSHENPYQQSVAGEAASAFETQNSWSSGDQYDLFGGQNAFSARDTVFNTDSNGFSYSANFSASAALGDGVHSASGASTTFEMYMSFDTDTLIDVSLRIDYERLMNTELYAGFSIDGAQDVQPDQIEVAHPGIDGYVDYSFQALVLAGDTFSLTNEAMLSYSTIENGDEFGTGQLSMSAMVRVVPAPGGLAMLSGFGLLAARRRR